MKLRTRWERGPREVVLGPKGKDGVPRPMLGKHGGPVVKQSVVKVVEPRGGA